MDCIICFWQIETTFELSTQDFKVGPRFEIETDVVSDPVVNPANREIVYRIVNERPDAVRNYIRCIIFKKMTEPDPIFGNFSSEAGAKILNRINGFRLAFC